MRTLLALIETLISDPEGKAAFAARPDSFLAENGFHDLDAADVHEVMLYAADTFPPAVSAQLAESGGLQGAAAIDLHDLGIESLDDWAPPGGFTDADAPEVAPTAVPFSADVDFDRAGHSLSDADTPGVNDADAHGPDAHGPDDAGSTAPTGASVETDAGGHDAGGHDAGGHDAGGHDDAADGETASPWVDSTRDFDDVTAGDADGDVHFDAPTHEHLESFDQFDHDPGSSPHDGAGFDSYDD